MLSIDTLIDDVLVKEGGFVNHPADRGGATNYGITQRTLSNFYGRKASAEEVRAMSEEVAREIYRNVYYYAPRVNKLPAEVQPQLFDMCVNHGPRNAMRMMQRVIVKAQIADISIDGINGPNTCFNAAKAQDAMGIYFNNAIMWERLHFYEAIVGRDPSQQVFLRGWQKRARSFEL